ncbi:MAG: hypothetical protein DYH15_02090 [Nitrosomonas sp. PRO4]|nr:hypothetical protein [Nitrosomonas sp. PRO4]
MPDLSLRSRKFILRTQSIVKLYNIFIYSRKSTEISIKIDTDHLNEAELIDLTTPIVEQLGYSAPNSRPLKHA